MNKENFIKALKISVIALLLMVISLVVVLRWKSDLIMERVMASLQEQLVDSLQYTEAGMDWFSYFPSTSIHISDLRLGSGRTPLIKGGSVDIVIRLLPLLKGKIVINSLQVSDSNIHIAQKDGRWSYEVMKKTGSTDEETFSTEVRKLIIDNSRVYYDDGKSLRFKLSITSGEFKGGMENEKLDLDIDMNSTIDSLKMDDYVQKEPFPSVLTGQYSFDMKSGLQEYRDWKIENEALEVLADGTILRESDHEVVDMDVSWKKANPELLKKWLPEKNLKTLAQYNLSGALEGNAKIEGKSSAKETPHVSLTAKLKDGEIHFLAADEAIKGLTIEVIYDTGTNKAGSTSRAEVTISKNSMLGSGLEGKVKIQNLDNPVYDISLSGSLPSGLLNLMSVEGLHFEKGTLDVRHFELSRFQAGTATFSSFLQRGKASLHADNIKLTYLQNTMEIPNGELEFGENKLTLDLDAFTWNKANVTDLKGTVVSHEHTLDFELAGKLCEGDVETKGNVTGMNLRPVSNATWKVTGIEMKQLLESFSNFDQTFITSENLKGKANIWAESTIPFDEKWNMLTEKVLVRSAIDIKDGQLKGMKTLEDFGAYVHIDDLRDIRFNQIRNYMKIENGTVYLPVMFIQSSALNMSISGEHTFDQDILYYLKLNAGQVVANKLKKNDVKKDFKKASKSGWINMYFVLSGTTSVVRYEQYRNAVIAGFEKSSSLKESLRNYLVEKFGYDVYWLEPNEWEDIPEYQ
jgi:hypothetical protein